MNGNRHKPTVATPGSPAVAMNSELPVNQWRSRKMGRKYHSGRATYSIAGSAGADSSAPPVAFTSTTSPSSTAVEREIARRLRGPVRQPLDGGVAVGDARRQRCAVAALE